jgi:hypothetical protein
MQVARSTPFEMQRSNRWIHASMHFRLIGGGKIAAFFTDFFEAFFVAFLVAIKSDSLRKMILGTAAYLTRARINALAKRLNAF